MNPITLQSSLTIEGRIVRLRSRICWPRLSTRESAVPPSQSSRRESKTGRCKTIDDASRKPRSTPNSPDKSHRKIVAC